MRKPDPRIMLLIAACSSTMSVLIDATWLLAFVYAITTLTVLAFGAKLLSIIAKLKGLLSVVAIIVLMESIFHKADSSLVSIGTVSILTTEGLTKGANTLLRIGTVISSSTIFTLTTARHMIQGLIQLKVPYELAFMASVALRFLPMFYEEFKDVLIAIQLRGVDIKRISSGKKLKLYISILTPVVFRAVVKAQKLSYAMELRAFRAFPKRTSRFTLKFSIVDYVYMTITFIITATVIFLYYNRYSVK